MEVFKAYLRKNVQVIISNEALRVHGELDQALACHEVHGQLIGYEDTHPALEILTEEGEVNIVNWHQVVNVIVEAP